MTLVAPINDLGCLSQLVARAKELAGSSEAAALADELRTLARVVDWYHALPQEDDDGQWSPGAIHCNVWQRARAFPEKPNCFERTLGYLALADRMAPWLRFTAITVETPAGLHTAPVLITRAGPSVVNLSPRVRNVDWNDVADAIHTIGQVALTIWGGAAGAAAGQALGKLEEKIGIRRSPDSSAQPGQTPPTKTPAPSATLKPLPVDQEAKWANATPERSNARDRSTMETARTTDERRRPPSSSSASAKADAPSDAPSSEPSPRRFALALDTSEPSWEEAP